jgi:hypothetical protein
VPIERCNVSYPESLSSVAKTHETFDIVRALRIA